jgi:hypothetical protein
MILRVKEAVERGDKVSRKTVFHQLLRPHAAEGYRVPTIEELNDDAYVFVVAAADTTGNAMTIAAYNVVSNPEKYERLTAELREQFLDPEAKMHFVTLEKLPYLVGCNYTIVGIEHNALTSVDCSDQGSTSVSISHRTLRSPLTHPGCHSVSLADFHESFPNLVLSSMATISQREYNRRILFLVNDTKRYRLSSA